MLFRNTRHAMIVASPKKPDSESLVPSRYPDFAGMMRPGHDQSTPFGFVCGRAEWPQRGAKSAKN
jgi:hypothetical protein